MTKNDIRYDNLKHENSWIFFYKKNQLHSENTLISSANEIDYFNLGLQANNNMNLITCAYNDMNVNFRNIFEVIENTAFDSLESSYLFFQDAANNFKDIDLNCNFENECKKILSILKSFVNSNFHFSTVFTKIFCNYYFLNGNSNALCTKFATVSF